MSSRDSNSQRNIAGLIPPTGRLIRMRVSVFAVLEKVLPRWKGLPLPLSRVRR